LALTTLTLASNASCGYEGKTKCDYKTDEIAAEIVVITTVVCWWL